MIHCFWALSLRRQLLVANLLVLVPALIAAAWSGVATLGERLEELGGQATMVATTTAAYLQRDLASFDRLAEQVAGDPGVRALDPDAARAVFARVLRGRRNLVQAELAAGGASVLARFSDTGEPIIVDGWWKSVLATGRHVAQPLPAASPARRYLVLGYPVVDENGRTVAALGLFVDQASVEATLAALPLPEQSVLHVVDMEGRVLASNQPETVGRSFVPVRGSAQVARPAARAEGLDGVERMFGEARIEAGPWIVSVGVPVAIAVREAGALWLRSFSILVLGMAGWLVVALVLTRRLTRAVGHLDATAQRIAAGDFAPIARRPMLSREFTQLQDAFDAMLKRFNETRQALEAQMAEERRIRQELESLQEQVIRQERLAAVGQLVSGVAHEINNPLQAILGFAELLQMQANVPENVKSDLRLIQKESARACGIIRNLAMFARQQPGEAAPVRLGDIVGAVAELRQRRLQSEDIELQVDDRSRQYVLAVPTELQQVVLNFVVNAEHAILTSGRLPGRIAIRTCDRAGVVVLEVEDTGPGVPPEHEAKLFQPFFTTKPVGQGTGLGLSVSYGIVDSLGGRIGYRRAPSGGAIFYFELPVASGETVGDL